MSSGGAKRRVNLPENLFTAEEVPTDLLRWAGAKEDPATGRMVAKERARKKTVPAYEFERTHADVIRMLETGDWQGVSARHLVALYAEMHERVYGFAPPDLGSKDRYNATMMAARVVKEHFDGSYQRGVAFMRWAWLREHEREVYRRKNHIDGQRIGPWLMFSGRLVGDFLAAERRR